MAETRFDVAASKVDSQLFLGNKSDAQNAALLVPLATDDGWRGLILFSTSSPAAYTEEQTELMGNMSSYMAHGFAR